MLKVVGASWLQTRIATYILIAVALLGIGAIILGEFGRVEKDGTYSATVSWNHKGGYRIDFWGQGNDLNDIPLHAARAYYKTGIFESGWSIVEIETSSKYPDMVQAYAAGLLEGSLTWQLIHHHWHNTVGAICEKKMNECRKIKRYLRENAAIIRERADFLQSSDPFWHMARLFYAQLDGLEAGWKFAVRRSRQSVEMESEDFLWLAMASDLPDLQFPTNNSKGLIFVKSFSRENMEPLTVIGHNTAAPYTKMLRLLKKYTFGYHVLPATKTAAVIPGRSVVMSSYPGALSSQDEYYLLYKESGELIVAGIPLSMTNRSLSNFAHLNDQVMSPVRIMAANRLAMNSQFWSQIMSFQNSGTSVRQWVVFESKSSTLLLVEQLPSITQIMDYTNKLKNDGFAFFIGTPHSENIKEVLQPETEAENQRNIQIARLSENITTLEEFKNLIRGGSHDEDNIDNQNLNLNHFDLPQILAYRGDLDKDSIPAGIIDTKISISDTDGVESFEAISSPVKSGKREPFAWSKSFPNISHMGQPDVFDFDDVTPSWVWI